MYIRSTTTDEYAAGVWLIPSVHEGQPIALTSDTSTSLPVFSGTGNTGDFHYPVGAPENRQIAISNQNNTDDYYSLPVQIFFRNGTSSPTVIPYSKAGCISTYMEVVAEWAGPVVDACGLMTACISPFSADYTTSNDLPAMNIEMNVAEEVARTGRCVMSFIVPTLQNYGHTQDSRDYSGSDLKRQMDIEYTMRVSTSSYSGADKTHPLAYPSASVLVIGGNTNGVLRVNYRQHWVANVCLGPVASQHGFSVSTIDEDAFDSIVTVYLTMEKTGNLKRDWASARRVARDLLRQRRPF